MNDRERYIATLLFGKPDKVPFSPGGPRESTLRAWRKQGLPEAVDWENYLRAQIGIEPLPKRENPLVWVKHEMIPQFEEKVIEEKERTLIVQDWKGNICEISNEYDVTYLRYPRDFVTRKWLKCPVETRDDWEAMRMRYGPDDPRRIPENIVELGKQLDHRDYVMELWLTGPFWQVREWVGFENLCMLCLDDPEFVMEMTVFWKEYISRLLERVLPYVKVDCVMVSEDMAYKHRSIISPDMVRRFIQPGYSQWNEIIKSNTCPIYAVDSDGFVGELIPIWIESGINMCWPIEVAAGNDINEFRRTFGKKMAFLGGVDKRAIAKGGTVIRDEMRRVVPVLETGGYIPGCDHGVPPDVTWNRFVEYSRILARMTGWI